MNMFQKPSESPEFSQHRKIRFGAHMLPKKALADKG
jgi:hypothetical protein